MGKTRIEWSQFSWNPVTGCTPCSPGCTHCYAERMARRLAGRCGYPEAPHHFDVTLRPERLEQPLHWRSPRRVFVCSMSDLFHEDVSFEFIDLVFLTMTACNGLHTFQVLTKRSKRMLEYFNSRQYYSSPQYHAHALPNVWLGTSVENQATADERIPLLLQAPAAMRFVSVEPMLESVYLKPWLTKPFIQIDPKDERWNRQLDWVICGGESGPGARPMHPDWARSLRDQCQAASVPFFFKQWGAWAPVAAIDTYKYKWALTHNTQRTVVSAHGLLGIDDVLMYRVGKKRAGRLLDGQVWDEFPVSAEVIT